MANAVNVKARRGMLCVHEARWYYTEQGTNHQVLTSTLYVSKVERTQGGQVQSVRDMATGAVRMFGGMDRVYLDSAGKLDAAKVAKLFAGLESAQVDNMEQAKALLLTCEVAQ